MQLEMKLPMLDLLNVLFTYMKGTSIYVKNDTGHWAGLIQGRHHHLLLLQGGPDLPGSAVEFDYTDITVRESEIITKLTADLKELDDTSFCNSFCGHLAAI